jgi:hypothetical protein
MSTMDMPAKAHKRSGHGNGHGHRLEFLAYAAIAFPLFLLVCTLARLVTLPLRLIGRGERKPSVFAEASEMTNSVIPWVFMGR